MPSIDSSASAATHASRAPPPLVRSSTHARLSDRSWLWLSERTGGLRRESLLSTAAAVPCACVKRLDVR